ncbi:MAG TPA: group III truncated hemoglobin [Acidocella sp.]|nr:group III truncated hemoglobin [Acidocella sp.]
MLDEPSLTRLVTHFYARLRLDPLLGPLFNRAIADWPEHLQRLAAFWSSVMLTTGRYKGQPLPAHLRHQAEIRPEMFERWLELWEQSAAQCLPPEGAAAVAAKAHRIAASLRMALFPELPPVFVPATTHASR